MDISKTVLQANSFAEFNPMQLSALKANPFENNLIISSPTASGKTIIAELCALHSIINNKRKVIYTCPLRALASEHYNDFKRKYSKEHDVRITISTGDLDSSSAYLQDYDLIFTTYEKLDSLIRHRAEWLSAVGLLMIDEVHELDSDRGATLEVLITKMLSLNPKLQLLALSATIPNAKEIAKWLSAKLVESDFRPVKLREGIYFNEEIIFDGKKKQKEVIDNYKEPLHSIVKNTLELKGKQALIFANTRKRAESIAKSLAPLTEKMLIEHEKQHLKRKSAEALNVLEAPTEQCSLLASLIEKGIAFHHAGLLQKQREIIEELFKSNCIKIISATPTLAAGVNLPAFRVIIPSLYRYEETYGQQRIPVREYKQMCFPYDTKVVTDIHGQINIGEIVDRKIDDCKILSFDQNKNSLEFNKLIKTFKRQENKFIMIFADGKWLTLTPNHPIFTRAKDGDRWVEAKDIRVGEKVIWNSSFSEFRQPPYFFELLPRDSYVVGVGQLFIQAKDLLSITEKELAKELAIDRKYIYHYKNNIKAVPLNVALKLCSILKFNNETISKIIKNVKSPYGNKLKIPERVNQDFLWLVGLIATDGNLNRQGNKDIKLRIFNKNKKIINKAAEVLRKLNLKPCITKRKDGLITLENGATLLANVLKKHFAVPYCNKTTTVEVPKILYRLSPFYIGSYLGGVFDGDGNYNEAEQRCGSKVRRVLFVTSSKRFADGLEKLFLKIGIKPTVKRVVRPYIAELKGKIVKFDKPLYYIIFRKINYIAKFAKYATIFKTKINVSYSHYHNLDDFYQSKPTRDYRLITINKKKEIRLAKPITVYNLQVDMTNNYFANNILVHNCGRAGRPRYDSSGESILIARSEDEVDELFENYINGKIEEITSKLGIAPLLRMHVLSAISDNFIFDLDSMENFFSKTFYAHQYKNLSELFVKIQEIIAELQEMGFVESDARSIKPTKLGRRVSELYLDPISAYKLILALRQQRKKYGELFYLYALANTSEFSPLISAQKEKQAELYELAEEQKPHFPIDFDKEQYSDPDILKKFSTSLLLQDWIDEISEQALTKSYNIQPGILHSKLRIADWLLYSALELAKLLQAEQHFSNLQKLRKRMEAGIKEELIALCEVRHIGRVRARRLFSSNIKGIGDLKNAPFESIARILGSAVAVKVKEQLGQEAQIPEELKKSKDEKESAGQKALNEF